MESGREVKEQKRTWRLHLGGYCRTLARSGGSLDEEMVVMVAEMDKYKHT